MAQKKERRYLGYLDDDEMSDRFYDSERFSTIAHDVRSSPLKYSPAFNKKMNRTPTTKFAAPTSAVGLVPQHQSFFDRTACKNNGPDPYNMTKKNMWKPRGTSTMFKEDPNFKSTITRFAAFGTTTNTRSYSKTRNLSTQNLGEQFRYHTAKNDIKARGWR